MAAKKIGFFLLAVVVIACVPLLVYGQLQQQLKWEELPSIPDREGYTGMYLGKSNGALLYMGGAERLPWENGENNWSDQIYILKEGAASWRLADEKLPVPMGYGASFSYKDKIIVVGGSNGKEHYANVYTVTYNFGKIKMESLPSLPVALANMAGAIVEDILFIAGGNDSPQGMPTKSFFALNLLGNPKDREWVEFEPWPGPARIQAVGASMHDSFFLFSGMNKLKEKKTKFNILLDGYRFIPDFNRGKIVGGEWAALPPLPQGVAMGPSPAPTFGLSHILFPDANSGKNLLAYNVKANTWLDFGNLPVKNINLIGPTVKLEQKWVMLTNGSKVFALSKKLQFGWINWLTLLAYLGLMLYIGFIYDKKGQTTHNFFTAGGRIPWWASGLSIYATQLSAITFMAIPAIVFATDWSLAIGSVMILASVPIVVKYYIPYFRKLSITSAYEYLEHRFSVYVRLLGSISFILFQMGRMGIVLYLPAIAIASVTGIDIYLIISIMGIICIIYTVMGGIEAVVWTDVSQVVILMGGAIFCLFVAIVNIEGGFTTVLSEGMEAGKFTLLHLGWEPDSLVLWVCIVGFFFLNIIPYTSDQTVIQRYFTVRDERQAAKSLWTNALITLPGTLVFFGLGTVLFVFYQKNPAVIPSAKVDEILPYFVVQQLPAGLAGLVIAGVFAASQSTLSSSMNSIAATYISDIYQRFRINRSDQKNLAIARKVTVLAGIFGTVSAMLIVLLEVQFIFNLFQEVLGILGGSLAGVFMLGVFTKRANTPGVICGTVTGVIAVLFIKNYTDISVYLYGAISVMSCVIVGYLVSLFTPKIVTGSRVKRSVRA